MSAPLGVALLNMGGPASAAEIEPFLFNLLSDPAMMKLPGFVQRPLARRISRTRAPKVSHRYDLIGGKSPVAEESQAQARALAEQLGSGFVVEPIMRYTAPRADEVLDRQQLQGVTRLVAVPAYPQWSATTSGSSVAELRSEATPRGIEVEEVPSYPTGPRFIDALAEGLLPLLEPGCYVLMTSHGLPESFIKAGDPYRDQVQQTAEALAARLPEGTPWSLAFQSRLGPVKWLQPYVEDEIARLDNLGARKLVTAPLTFAVENLETLYDLDIVAAEQAKDLGFQLYRRAPAPGRTEAFIDELSRITRETVARAGWEQ